MKKQAHAHGSLIFIAIGAALIIGGFTVLISPSPHPNESESSRELICEFESEILPSGEKAMICRGKGIEGEYVTIELLDKDGKSIGYDNVFCMDEFDFNTFVPERTHTYTVHWQNE